jgi:uncharacterized RDD family membrane protein YckC
VTMYPPPPESTPPPYEGGASGPRAGFWRRFGGALIDGILIGILSAILQSAVSRGAGYGLGTAIGLVYFTLMIGSSRGQTLGQMAVGIRVIDFNTGGPIGYGRAFIRWLVSLLSALAIFIGYLWMLWDKEKQCWHDKAANDVVVPVSSYPIKS